MVEIIVMLLKSVYNSEMFSVLVAGWLCECLSNSIFIWINTAVSLESFDLGK